MVRCWNEGYNILIRSKAEKIKFTLSILEQWKFFFNLASSLQEMVKKGRYDAAVRDYKKGKYLMESSFRVDDENQLFDGADNDVSTLLPKHYQPIFEKLWAAVEQVISDFCDELFISLSIMSNPVEHQEKVIGY
jgi:exocyst complex component 2